MKESSDRRLEDNEEELNDTATFECNGGHFHLGKEAGKLERRAPRLASVPN